MKYTRNPPEVDAVQWDGTVKGAEAIREFIMTFLGRAANLTVTTEIQNDGLIWTNLAMDRIVTRDAGPMREGYWLLHHEGGAFEIYSNDLFRKHYSRTDS